MSETIMECRSIQKSFAKRGESIQILRDINLQVQRNEIVVITGKSGEGKSVLLWLLAQLDRPTGGEVLYKGVSLTRMPRGDLAKMRSRSICMIFQDFNLIPIWTALENVTAALIHSGLKRQDAIGKAALMLERVGLSGKLDYFPAELSIGQRQRVAIARNLINDPEIIVADEPTGGLDPETADAIIDLMAEPVRKKNSSLIVATHGNFPLAVADRVLYLKGGMLS